MKMIEDTNPDHYKVDGANFIEYMNDPKISGFGNWMFADGFNSGVWADTNWISVKERLPEAETHVLAACEIKPLYAGYTTKYVCDAFYAPKHTVSAGRYPDDCECYEYDEEADEYFLLEGWYEVIKNWDDYNAAAIADFVTHWMPLPEPPKEEAT